MFVRQSGQVANISGPAPAASLGARATLAPAHRSALSILRPLVRTALSRLFLVALIGVAVFAVIRLASSGSGALVAFDSLDADALEHRAFALTATATLAIDAAGSYEERGTPASDTTLAAYGWIVRREDGAVAWRMHPPRPERGTLVSVADTVRLPAGTYDAYFTSHGDPLVRADGPRDGSLVERVRDFLSRGGRSWVGEAARWRFRIDVVGDGSVADDHVHPGDPADAEPGPDSLRLWQARGVRNHDRRDVLLTVTEAAEVTVQAVTEITDGVVADVPSIVRLGRRDTVWTASGDGSAWAGGSLKNRRVEARVRLEPGVYQVAFDGDRSHGYADWAANPPWRPETWGMTVSRAAGAVSLLDPDALDLPVIASHECAGPDEDWASAFTVAEPSDVLIVAVGEIESGSRYDHASLDVLDGGEVTGDPDWGQVWTMTDALEPAGGDAKNKRAVRALSLDPGTYRLRYQTDRSHDCQTGYNSDGGPDGALWGVILYALDASADPASFSVRDITEAGEPPPAEAPVAERPEFPTSGLLASIDRVGDRQDRRVPFRLAEPAEVRVIAAGELSASRGFDYATIERDGRVVWEMAYANTSPASGDAYHRQFDGPVRLGAGLYELRYRTDGSRSTGDFGPSSDVLWGARVYALDSAEAAVAEGSDPAAALAPEIVGGLQAVQDLVVYPEDARREGVRGTVTVRATIGVKGRALSVSVVESPDPRLSEAAALAVQQARYRPGVQDGQPVPTPLTIPVRFGPE